MSAARARGAAVHGVHLGQEDLLALGEDQAAGRGVDVLRIQRLAFISASLATGAAVSVGGPIGFIGIGNMGWPMAANLVNLANLAVKRGAYDSADGLYRRAASVRQGRRPGGRYGAGDSRSGDRNQPGIRRRAPEPRRLARRIRPLDPCHSG